MIGFRKMDDSKKDKPKKLTRKGETLTDSNTGDQYTVKTKLQGRGQPGEANFYQSTKDGPQLLIKEDNAATCLLEGTAYFVEQSGLLPSPLTSAVNYAALGCVYTLGSEAPPSVVSIQDRVKPLTPEGGVRPWDELVYGRKRNPRTIWSEESWDPKGITDNVYGMGSDARWQLAAAIFSSAVAGDESLHVGQYMAVVDKDDNIVGIKRIDLGARERFAQQRHDTLEESGPFNCSALYQGAFYQGQGGKDYLGFLLAEPTLMKQYTMLWARLNQQDETELAAQVYDSSFNSFMAQLDNLPDTISEPSKKSGTVIKDKEQIIDEVLKIVNKSAEKPLVLKGDAQAKGEALAKHLATLDSQRVLHMKKVASAQYTDLLHKKGIEIQKSSFEPRIKEMLSDAVDFQSHSVLKVMPLKKISENSAQFIANIDEPLKACQKAIILAPNDQKAAKEVALICEVAIDTLECEKLKLLENKAKNQDRIDYINNDISTYSTYLDCARYLQKTSSPVKQKYVSQILACAMEGKPQLEMFLTTNPKMIESMTSHQNSISWAASGVATVKTGGHMFLEQLFSRYHLSQAKLSMTEQQAKLLTAVGKKDYQQALTLITKGDLYTSLAPDKFGMTALHHLMLEADNPEGYQAIVEVIRKFVGQKFTQSLDWVDNDNNTPYHLLMQNPHYQDIINALNEAKIYGRFSRKPYKMKHCFGVKENNNKETPQQILEATLRAAKKSARENKL